MPKCKKCGTEISEQQYKSLKGMCPKCSLLKYLNQRIGWIVLFATVGILLAFVAYIVVLYLM
ncbi:MAG: hypothetical protein EU535_01935 [Promethearchaeota archaeon]|nr:MAG: hypothetical protein EU535_01935 [Candidatus Lokiarchaeota archaeon]